MQHTLIEDSILSLFEMRVATSLRVASSLSSSHISMSIDSLFTLLFPFSATLPSLPSLPLLVSLAMGRSSFSSENP